MTRKKEINLAISAEENTQVQDLLAYYHQIADTLHTSADQQQAEAALADITSLPETSQLALLKALSKELHTDAADLLLALRFSPMPRLQDALDGLRCRHNILRSRR